MASWLLLFGALSACTTVGMCKSTLNVAKDRNPYLTLHIADQTPTRPGQAVFISAPNAKGVYPRFEQQLVVDLSEAGQFIASGDVETKGRCYISSDNVVSVTDTARMFCGVGAYVNSSGYLTLSDTLSLGENSEIKSLASSYFDVANVFLSRMSQLVGAEGSICAMAEESATELGEFAVVSLHGTVGLGGTASVADNVNLRLGIGAMKPRSVLKCPTPGSSISTSAYVADSAVLDLQSRAIFSGSIESFTHILLGNASHLTLTGDVTMDGRMVVGQKSVVDIGELVTEEGSEIFIGSLASIRAARLRNSSSLETDFNSTMTVGGFVYLSENSTLLSVNSHTQLDGSVYLSRGSRVYLMCGRNRAGGPCVFVEKFGTLIFEDENSIVTEPVYVPSGTTFFFKSTGNKTDLEGSVAKVESIIGQAKATLIREMMVSIANVEKRRKPDIVELNTLRSQIVGEVSRIQTMSSSLSVNATGGCLAIGSQRSNATIVADDFAVAFPNGVQISNFLTPKFMHFKSTLSILEDSKMGFHFETDQANLFADPPSLIFEGSVSLHKESSLEVYAANGNASDFTVARNVDVDERSTTVIRV